MRVLIITLVTLITLNVAMLSSCAWFGYDHVKTHHIDVPSPTEDVRG